MKKLLLFFGGLFLIFLNYGCTVGRVTSFQDEKLFAKNGIPLPGYTSNKNIVFVFQEKRHYVLNGKRKESYCGYLKSTAQIPYSLNTRDNTPLAVDFTNTLTKSFKDANFNADSWTVSTNTSADTLLSKFESSGKERLLVFTINEWEISETPGISKITYRVKYDFSLNVYNQSGKSLAGATVQQLEIEKKFQPMGGVKDVQQMGFIVFQTQIKKLMNNDNIKASLL